MIRASILALLALAASSQCQSSPVSTNSTDAAASQYEDRDVAYTLLLVVTFLSLIVIIMYCLCTYYWCMEGMFCSRRGNLLSTASNSVQFLNAIRALPTVNRSGPAVVPVQIHFHQLNKSKEEDARPKNPGYGTALPHIAAAPPNIAAISPVIMPPEPFRDASAPRGDKPPMYGMQY